MEFDLVKRGILTGLEKTTRKTFYNPGSGVPVKIINYTLLFKKIIFHQQNSTFSKHLFIILFTVPVYVNFFEMLLSYRVD